MSYGGYTPQVGGYGGGYSGTAAGYAPPPPQVDPNLKLEVDAIYTQFLNDIGHQHGVPLRDRQIYWSRYNQEWMQIQQNILQFATAGGIPRDAIVGVLDDFTQIMAQQLRQSQATTQARPQTSYYGSSQSSSQYGANPHAIPLGSGGPANPYATQPQYAPAPVGSSMAGNTLAERKAQEMRARQQQQVHTQPQPDPYHIQSPTPATTSAPQSAVASSPQPTEVGKPMIFNQQPEPGVSLSDLSVPNMHLIEAATIYVAPELKYEIGSMVITDQVPQHEAATAVADILEAVPLAKKHDQWVHFINYPQVHAPKLGNVEGVAEKFERIGEILSRVNTLQGILDETLPVLNDTSKAVGNYLERFLLDNINNTFRHFLIRADAPLTNLTLESWDDLQMLLKDTDIPQLKQLKATVTAERFRAAVTLCASRVFYKVFGSATRRVLTPEQDMPILATTPMLVTRVENFLPRDYGVMTESAKSRFVDILKRYLFHVRTRQVIVTNMDLTSIKGHSPTVIADITHPLHQILVDQISDPEDLVMVGYDTKGENVKHIVQIGRSLEGNLIIF